MPARLLPAGAIAGWALHPLEKRRLVTAHLASGRWPCIKLSACNEGCGSANIPSEGQRTRIRLGMAEELAFEDEAAAEYDRRGPQPTRRVQSRREAGCGP